MSESIRVCVRVRPYNQREKDREKVCIIGMYKNATIITRPDTLALPEEKQLRQVFTFDHSFWSMDEPQPHGEPIVTQADVYQAVGVPVLKSCFDGYHGCIMAYGQSGSGKTHTMMGGTDPVAQGLIPRLGQELFERIALAPHLTFKVELSYLEIYAEQIRDLLDPSNTQQLRVREHPEQGPFVENLTLVPVEDYYTVNQFLLLGTHHRVTASTQLNDRSSRSHAIVTLYVTQMDPATSEVLFRSKLSLVDLAGSERVKDSGVKGVQFQEAVNINTSLTTLGRVIAILAKVPEVTGKVAAKAPSFVPFRDSYLTWLLKDSLGGNSKTVMVATLSPSHINYDETLGTLQYAYRTKQIVNRVTVNASKNELLITKLREELKTLEQKWTSIHQVSVRPLVESAPVSSETLDSIRSQWEERVRVLQQQQDQSLHHYQTHWSTVKDQLQWPFLLALDPDLSMEQDLIYYLALGPSSVVGREGHVAHLFHDEETGVWLVPMDPATRLQVNGVDLGDEPRILHHGDRVTLQDQPFKFKVPICAIR